ncbi:hypothetical protein AMJ47_01105 [Parcubacteria bacterium DG_72]|nr:MAG: hypothetical protein AMJ47_01105 [Parcubacteria bacterium DG_72]
MFKRYYLIFLILILLLAGASCKKEERAAEVSLQDIIGPGAFIKDQISLDIDEDKDKEDIVLYVLAGRFYLAVVDQIKVKSKVELLTEQADVILPKDFNGDGKEFEFAFNAFDSGKGIYVEIIGWNKNTKELLRYNFYKDEDILEELFVSSINDIKYENGFLIQSYYSDVEPIGFFTNYYSFSEEKQGFEFEKSEKTAD